MRTIISFIPFLIFFACGSSGIEGYVDEPITITAENPEEGKDVDYFWTLADLPDGSLMNSGDLISSDDGQEMVFTPDYPGDYSVEVVISQYGDEISNQTFAFLIMDPSERDAVSDEDSEEPENEDWLNEEMDEEIDDEEENDDDLYEEDEDIDDEEADLDEDDESGNKTPVAKMTAANAVTAKASEPKKGTSIAARTDRFTIQITSKKMLKDAQLFSQKLISKGYDSYIQKVVFKTDEIWYRVRVGSYDNYNSAKAAADDLSGELGMATWVDFVRKEQ
ncbi:MAG TPA: SPOR domain-containing protein [Candidatus Marinimicrobia bacterium]|nr:SPOR domain-containing protein [Candidatus Neomarinimicrobiota bacterium]